MQAAIKPAKNSIELVWDKIIRGKIPCVIEGVS